MPPIEVLLLTRADCAFCEQAKTILTQLAQEFVLHITTLDLATPAGEAMALQGGILFPPGIFLDGQPFAYGRPSARQLRREFRRRQPTLTTTTQGAIS